MSHEVFLSYSSKNIAFVKKLRVDLLNLGVPLWFDKDSLRIGNDWLEEIETAIATSKVFICIVSEAYYESSICQLELAEAYKRNIVIIPVVIENLRNKNKLGSILENLHMDFLNGFIQWRNSQQYEAAFQNLNTQIELHEINYQYIAPETQYLNSITSDLQENYSLLQYIEVKTQIEKQKSRVKGEIINSVDSTNIADDRFYDSNSIDDLLQLVNDIGRFIILGDAGVGKTTTLRYLALQIAEKKRKNSQVYPLPIFIQLADWKTRIVIRDGQEIEEAIPFITFISQREHHYNFFTSSTDLASALKAGRAMLFLDGLDEMAQDQWFDQRIQYLREFILSEEPPQYLVITCRAENYVELEIPSLKEISLDAWDKEQIENFLKRFAFDENEARSLTSLLLPKSDEIINQSHLFHLAKNPFLLSAIVTVYHQNPNSIIPNNPALLLQELVKLLWRYVTTYKDELDFESVQSSLAKLAYKMTSTGKARTVNQDWAINSMKDSSIANTVTNFFKRDRAKQEKENILKIKEFANEAYMLREEGSYIRFQHPLLHSYFSAKYIVDNGLKDKISVSKFVDGKRIVSREDWDSVLLMALELNAEQKDNIYKQILNNDPYLAIKLVSNGYEANAKNSRDLVDRLLLDFETNPERRDTIIEALLVIDINAYPTLSSYLLNGKVELETRLFVIDVIAKLGSDLAINDLAQVIHDPKIETPKELKSKQSEVKKIREEIRKKTLDKDYVPESQAERQWIFNAIAGVIVIGLFFISKDNRNLPNREKVVELLKRGGHALMAKSDPNMLSRTIHSDNNKDLSIKIQESVSALASMGVQSANLVDLDKELIKVQEALNDLEKSLAKDRNMIKDAARGAIREIKNK